MNKFRSMKMRDMKSEDIFAIYTEYVKDSIAEDLQSIYKEEVKFVDAKEPWVFKLGEK